MPLFGREFVILSIIQASAPLYEIGVSHFQGAPPMKIGYALEEFNKISQESIDDYEAGENQMAREFLEWVYLGKDKPDWVKEGFE